MAYTKILKAVYDYEATAEDELNFIEGDILGVVGTEDEEGWVYGCNILKDPECNGFIPLTYCEELNEPIETIKSHYSYEAQEENELSFGEGQTLELLHKIDEDWWLATDGGNGYGMVPANYFTGSTETEQETVEAEPTEFVNNSYEAEQEYEPEYSNEQEESYEQESQELTDEKSYETVAEEEEEEVEVEEEYTAPPPPPPLPKNPVENLKESSALKFKCDALFLDSNYVKCKGQLMLEKALYLCSSDSIENVYDLDNLRDYDAVELKMTLNSGEKVAIGLGKKDAKKFAELVKEISGYEPEDETKPSAEPASTNKVEPKFAPIVVGPKMPEPVSNNDKTEPATAKKSETSKVPMMVGVSFEGLEGEEISIFEGEEVYLLSDPVDSDNQFARIEKINGVQGIVPRNFLMTRSEHQKKMAEIEETTEKQFSNMNIQKSPAAPAVQNIPVMPSVSVPKQEVVTNNTTLAATSNSLARSTSKNSPWSALASGSIPKQQPSNNSSSNNNVKLENSRLWKDKSGKFQVEAEFVSLSDGKVTILKTSGSQVTVPLEVLSEKDAEYACKRAGIPYSKKTATNTSTTAGSTIVKGFDWSAFFLSLGIAVDKAKEFGTKFASQSFEESMISAFTSDFLSAQGMQMTEIYKILPEAAKRKAQAMQSAAKEKHRNNNSQMVLRSPEASGDQLAVYEGKNTAAAVNTQESHALTRANTNAVNTAVSPVEIEKFPTIEELEAQGGIEVGREPKASVTLPNGISVSKTSTSDSNTRVLVQPINDVKERTREVVASDGSTAKEYTRISSSTTIEPVVNVGSSAIALMQQQQAQQNAMMQMRMQAQAQAQMQMQMQAQAQAQAQMQAQMQMRAQAQAQAQAQYMAAAQQQRMYQQQQQQAPSVHITIHTGDKVANNPNPPSMMTPPIPMINQPMMQMNTPGMMGGPMSGAMIPGGTLNPMNPMMNPMGGQNYNNPFDPNFYNGGYPF